mgnify:FL=1
MQTGLASAWKHLDKFDPKRGALLTFLILYVRSAAGNRLQYHIAEKRNKFKSAAPIIIEGIEVPLENRGQQNTPSAEDMAVIEETLKNYSRTLTKKEATILGLRTSGYTEKEVANIVGIDSTNVKYQVQKARKKIKDNDLTR